MREMHEPFLKNSGHRTTNRCRTLSLSIARNSSKWTHCSCGSRKSLAWCIAISKRSSSRRQPETARPILRLKTCSGRSSSCRSKAFPIAKRQSASPRAKHSRIFVGSSKRKRSITRCCARRFVRFRHRPGKRSAKSPARFRRIRAFARKRANWMICVRRWNIFRCRVGCVIWATS